MPPPDVQRALEAAGLKPRAATAADIASAIGLCVLLVRTDNDETNAPMLHINEKLGYHRVPGWLSFIKEV